MPIHIQIQQHSSSSKTDYGYTPVAQQWRATAQQQLHHSQQQHDVNDNTNAQQYNSLPQRSNSNPTWSRQHRSKQQHQPYTQQRYAPVDVPHIDSIFPPPHQHQSHAHAHGI